MSPEEEIQNICGDKKKKRQGNYVSERQGYGRWILTQFLLKLQFDCDYVATLLILKTC